MIFYLKTLKIYGCDSYIMLVRAFVFGHCFSFNSIYSSATFGVVWIAEKVSLNCIFSRSTQRSPLCFIGSVRKVLSEGSR